MQEADVYRPGDREQTPYRRVLLDRVGSTNEVARQRIGAGQTEDGLCVIAREQTAGRGTGGKPWVSQPGGLWFTLVVAAPPDDLPMHLWAGVAVHRAVADALGHDLADRVEIKWPNDVLIGGKKTAGILIETVCGPDQTLYGLVGVGINVNQTELPEPVKHLATTMRAHAGRELALEDVLDTVLTELDRLRGQPETVVEQWLARSRAVGRRVRVGENPAVMIVRGVTQQGALVVSPEDREHELLVVHSATGTPVRPADG